MNEHEPNDRGETAIASSLVEAIRDEIAQAKAAAASAVEHAQKVTEAQA